MKEVLDEIQAPVGRRLDASLLASFVLGAITVGVLMAAIGVTWGEGGGPIHSGTIAHIEEQVDGSTRHGSSYAKDDQIRGRLYPDYLLIERQGKVEFIPSHRVHRVEFHD
jgi:hypothetical protein